MKTSWWYQAASEKSRAQARLKASKKSFPVQSGVNSQEGLKTMQDEPDGEEIFALSCASVVILCILVAACYLLTGIAADLVVQVMRR